MEFLSIKGTFMQRFEYSEMKNQLQDLTYGDKLCF